MNNNINYNSIKEKTEDLLLKYGINEPVVNVFQIAEGEGVNLKFVDMPEKLKEVAGFFDIDTKTIFVNNNDPTNRQTFTIAHELGHYILGHKAGEYSVLFRFQKFNGENPPVEKAANCFAANLLVPEKMLISIMKKYNLSKDDDELLAKMFGVSQEMMGYRIRISNSC